MYILHATLHFLHKTWTTIISVGQEDRKRQQHGKNTVEKVKLSFKVYVLGKGGSGHLCLIQVVQLRSRILSLLLFSKAVNISMVNMPILEVSALPFLSFFVHRKCGRLKARNVY